jgi:hypothetical protein
MTGPGFSPPDLEKRLAWNVKANELLGRRATELEVEEMRLCYANGWTPEEYVRVMVYRSEKGRPAPDPDEMFERNMST